MADDAPSLLARRGSEREGARQLAVLAAIALVALNLRTVFGSISPILGEIEHSTGLSSAGAGLLTTIPVLAFAACAPLAPVIGRRFGLEITIFGVLSLLGVGLVIRSLPSLALLFVGTALAGIAIAIGNVLVPALVKRDFPARPQLATGVYSVGISASAALAAGLTVPVGHALGLGWRGELVLYAAPVAVTLLVWAAWMRGARHDVDPTHVGGQLWRDPLAWQVTAFMGLQSLNFYSMLTWLPTIFEQHGVQVVSAGWLLSLSGFASLPAAFVAPVLASNPRRQKVAIAVTVVLNAGALSGLLSHPVGGAIAWMVLLGLSQGSALALALSFIVMRASTTQRAAELSAMAQTVGYLVASAGPFLVGLLREVTGGWQVPLVALVVLLVPELLSGFGASRPRVVRPAAQLAT